MKHLWSYLLLACCLLSVGSVVWGQVGYTWSGGTGNWSVATNWTPNGVPTATDTVNFIVTTPASVCTIDRDAACAKLIMLGSGTTNGPTLQYPTAGAITLTVVDSLKVTGGSGTNVQGGRPKLTSNGNTAAILKLFGYVLTTSSNSTANGNPGLNMNEGSVVFAGTAASLIEASAGLRLGNLQIGDGTNAKVVTFQVSTNSSQRISPGSVTVKSGCTFYLGGTSGNAGNYGVSIGTASTGTIALTGGIVIDSGATMAVQAPSASNSCTIELQGGGITNNGTFVTKASGGGFTRTLNVNVSSLTVPGSASTFGGKNPMTFAAVVVSNPNGAVLAQNAAVTDSLVIKTGSLFNLQSSTLTLGAAARLNEAAGYPVTGSTGVITTTRTLTSPGAGTDIAGLGVKIGSSADLGSTVITRGHAPQSAGAGGIKRYFDITTSNPGGASDTLTMLYDRSELNGKNPVDLKLFKSTNAGSLWTLQGGTVDTASRQITLLNVNGFSRWTAAPTSASAVEEETGAPMQFQLLQNYPNPFNPSTRIRFSVSATDRARVRLYNVLGQQVSVLFDDVAEAGRYYSLQLDAGQLSSGVYYYTLESGTMTATKKLVLLK